MNTPVNPLPPVGDICQQLLVATGLELSRTAMQVLAPLLQAVREVRGLQADPQEMRTIFGSDLVQLAEALADVAQLGELPKLMGLLALEAAGLPVNLEGVVQHG